MIIHVLLIHYPDLVLFLSFIFSSIPFSAKEMLEERSKEAEGKERCEGDNSGERENEGGEVWDAGVECKEERGEGAGEVIGELAEDTDGESSEE